MISLILVIILFYSLLCAPDIVLRYFDFNDSLEHAFMYLILCLIVGLTGAGVSVRIYQLFGDSNENL